MYYSWGDPADLRNPEKQGMNFFFLYFRAKVYVHKESQLLALY